MPPGCSIQHNTEYLRITEEIRGKEATQKMAMMEAERNMEAVQREREKERALLYGALPRSVADRKLRGEDVSGDRFEHAAVLFADVVGFTTHSSSMDPTDVVALLEHMFSAFDAICDQHGVTKVKTIGDAYMCFKGDVGGSDNAWALAQVALAMQRTTLFWPSNVAHEVAHEVAHNVAHNVAHEVAHNVDHNVAHKVLLRIGLHLGPATAGVIGTQRLQYDVWGDTVNVASRLESSCEPGRIHVSEAFANDLREAFVIPNPEGVSDLHLELRGEVELKGKGLVKTFWLTSATDHP